MAGLAATRTAMELCYCKIGDTLMLIEMILLDSPAQLFCNPLF